jgi:hypothetical protein
MSQSYDLDLFLDETYDIKIGGDVYTLPKQPRTGLQKKVTALQMKIAEMVKKDGQNSDPMKISDLMQESVILILGQDKHKSKKLTSKFIDENFTDGHIQQIIKIFFDEIKGIEEKN